MKASRETRRVRIKVDVGLLDDDQDEVRVPVAFEVEAKVDHDRAVPVAVRFVDGSPSAVAGKIDIRLRHGEHYLAPLQAWDPDEVPILAPHYKRDRRRTEEISLYDLTGELELDDAHASTGGPQRRRGGGLVVLLDGSVVPEQRYGRERYEIASLAGHAARIRALAAERLLFREPEGWFVPSTLPVINLQQNAANDPAWRIVVHAGYKRSETSFDLNRLEDARAFCRHMNGGIDGEIAGRIVEADHFQLPISNDLVAIASRGVPEAMGAKVFDLQAMTASLVLDWHVARNGRSIVESEGLSGAERVLASTLRLAAHIEDSGLDIERVRDWAVLRERILFEGIRHVPAPPEFRP